MSSNFTEKDADFLLQLARLTIKKRSKSNILTNDEINDLPSIYKEKRGCFVTINLNGNLRGCIGYILPIQPLYQAVIDNAYNCANSDPRFPPVTDDEIDNLHIEISILTVPEQLDYKNADDLLDKLIPLKHGIIIKKGFRSSTFLPQVWEQLPKKEDFLAHLCLKAGLKPDEWKQNTLEVEFYEAEVFEEEK